MAVELCTSEYRPAAITPINAINSSAMTAAYPGRPRATRAGLPRHLAWHDNCLSIATPSTSVTAPFQSHRKQTVCLLSANRGRVGKCCSTDSSLLLGAFKNDLYLHRFCEGRISTVQN